MPSIVSILKKESMLGFRDYSNKEPFLNNMFLFFEGEIISSDFIAERYSRISDGHLGYVFGTCENPHDPIDLGFSVSSTKSSSMNSSSIAEQIHMFYDGSTDYEKIFSNLFPEISGEITLYPELDGINNSICNKQWYEYGPVTKEMKAEILKSYKDIAGYDLLPF